MKEALERLVWDRLPDPQAAQLRKALAMRLGVEPENIVVGNGSAELIRFLAMALFEPGDAVVIPQPTFGEYEPSACIAGATLLMPRAREEEGFRPDLEGLLRLLTNGIGGLDAGPKPAGIYLCNPNNPTGVYLSRNEVEDILDALPNGVVILDEAYVPFVHEPWSSLDLVKRGNLVILRSMTKDFALGGLRLGYAVGPERIVQTVQQMLPPWNVNSLAQEAGLLALEDWGYPARCLPSILEASDYLVAELRALELDTLPSRTNFFLANVGDACAFRRFLLKNGCMVRDCTSFGLPEYIRIAARTLPESKRLIEVISLAVQQEGKAGK